MDNSCSHATTRKTYGKKRHQSHNGHDVVPRKRPRTSEPSAQQIAATDDSSDDEPHNSDDDMESSTMTLLSAIVAAATGAPQSYAQYPDTPAYDDSSTNDEIMRAIQDLDMTKVASMLRGSVGEGNPPSTRSSTQHTKHQGPTPVGQIPVSSVNILGNNKSASATGGALPSSNHAYLLANKWMPIAKLKELVETEGLVYKKGKFSAIEEQQIKDVIKRMQLSDDALEALIFPKKKQRNCEFWTELANAVEQRPVIAVYHYVRRAYHPQKGQGKWLDEEDQALRQAVVNLGGQWEKISAEVGRPAQDCRDRYRNHLKNREDRLSGPWSEKEEERLITIVTRMTKGKDQDNDIFWKGVSEQMGNTRTRAQCRIKWADTLSRKVKSGGGKVRWKNADAYILVHKIDSLHVQDDSEIDWKTLPDPNWNLFSAHILQRRWRAMKQSVQAGAGVELSHQEIVDILKAKKNIMDEIED